MYFESIVKNNITYSVDKLRVKTYISYTKFTELEFRFKTVWSHLVKKFYTSSGISSFFYNYNIEVEEGKSFYFGFLHNTEKRSLFEEKEYNLTVEFNPNKLKHNDVLLYILKLSDSWFIRSCDLAFDIPVNILNIIYDKGRKRNIHIFSNGYDNKTICIGSRESDLYLKIYNKKIESNLNILGDLTRIELTKTFEDYPLDNLENLNILNEHFPILFLNEYLYSLDTYKDKTMFAVLYAIQNGFDLNMLTRRYRDRIKELLNCGCKIDFDSASATYILRKVLIDYFVKISL